MKYHVICASFGTTEDGWGNDYNSEYLPLVICDESRSVSIRNSILAIQRQIGEAKEKLSRMSLFWIYCLYGLAEEKDLIWPVCTIDRQKAQEVKDEIDLLRGEYPIQAFIGSYADDHVPLIEVYSTLVKDIK